METIDFTKELKDLYAATHSIKEITVPRGVFLGMDGRGKPGGKEFQRAIENLYSVAYTVKFTLKGAGIIDFKIPKLECLWFVEDPKRTPPSQWEWRVLLRIPEEVTKEHIKQAVQTIRDRKGLDASGIRRISWHEGRALQKMHIGPYDKVEDAYMELGSQAEQLGYRIKGPGHEIYINDPNRVAPEKLKTIVRLPVAHPRPAYARASQVGKS